MDKLVNCRKTKRTQSTNTVNAITAELAVEDPDINDLEANLEFLKELQSMLDELDEKVATLLLDNNASEEDRQKEADKAGEYKKKFLLAKLKVEGFGRKNNVSPVPSEVGSLTGGGEKRKYKLPTIEFKKFNGELTEWLGFWSQFDKIHNDATIRDCDKFQYLLMAMEPGTHARELVEGYTQTGDNYNAVVKTLKERYGDEDLLLQVYVRELLKLVISNAAAKEKIPFQQLFMKLESHLRSLQALNLSQADPETWLFPLIESSLPEDILLVWQRSSRARTADDEDEGKLSSLMNFLRREVSIQQKILLAQSGFETMKIDANSKGRKRSVGQKDSEPTLAGLHNAEGGSCLFCEKQHESRDCFVAQGMPLKQKRDILTQKRCCWSCLKRNHVSTKCKAFLKCIICGHRHHPVMCSERESKVTVDKSIVQDSTTDKSDSSAANHVCNRDVVLQTVTVTLHGNGRKKNVRAFMDNGSQRSYILKSTAEELGLVPIAEEIVNHSLFGGTTTTSVKHKRYTVNLQQVKGKFACNVEVRDQRKICNSIPRVSTTNKGLFEVLKRNNIWISDVGDDMPDIELLIGADIWAKLLTGKIVNLVNGMTAIETKLGWTLAGEMVRMGAISDSSSMLVLDMTVSDYNVTELWNLDTLGVKDPIESQSSAEQEMEAKKELLKTMSRNEDGRYVVGLPWAKGHPTLPSNRELLSAWKDEGFIEEVSGAKDRICHYLPHRAVIKPESLTTPVRPVFDASCKTRNYPSLNDCLEKGPNYVQLIPAVLLRFREKKVGVISDIRKAFQMIEVRKEDRDVLRFLWWEDKNMKKCKVYRHCRVVFGATCSPFILGAILEHHLTNVKEEDKIIADMLMQSLYVDNCVISLNNYEEYLEFREKATEILLDAQMDLRMWMTNEDKEMDEVLTSVLGLKWNKKEDTLAVDVSSCTLPESVTKRSILSVIQKLYDPIGFLAPAIISMKILLQQAWIAKVKWDDELPEENCKQFKEWYAEISHLSQIVIPRMITDGESDRDSWSMHTFTDASQQAYAAVVFLRVKCKNKVLVQLIGAKARVAPLKQGSIPRLELLGCLIGSRLANTIKKSLNLETIAEYYWTDSATALAWIRRDDCWATFVGNRVTEIRNNTKIENWHHVPGKLNPADLPSRGCSPSQLSRSRWWEGTLWLRLDESQWPNAIPNEEEPDDNVVAVERRKTPPPVTAMSIMDDVRKDHSFTGYVRIRAWGRRFIFNAKNHDQMIRKSGPLCREEIDEAEITIIKDIQCEAFPCPEELNIPLVVRDNTGLLRVKTKIILRKDVVDFTKPYLLPRAHPLVEKLIMQVHRQNCHAGLGIVMCKLREKYWILQSRRSIQNVLKKCLKCKRYSAKPVITEMAPLPPDRIDDAEAFEVVGVDLAGPLILRNGNKTWIVLFTCAVFRAVHLELVSSLKTEAFIRAMHSFIRKYRRPSTVYSDNGTNFHGAVNFFRKLDWKKILEDQEVKPIRWKFNPPSAAWWGGIFERLIRSMKDMLKRMGGRGNLKKEELALMLGEVQDAMNNRPLTYVSDDPEDLVPLTPMMFLRPHGQILFPEGELSEAERMRIRFKYLTQLKSELRERFRKEYLAQLVGKPGKQSSVAVKVGDVVLIGSDDKKRITWPLARIIETFPGRDGVVRVAKLKTQDGILTRPVRRLYPLELDEHSKTTEKLKRSRSGRVLRPPIKFQ